MFDSCLVWLSAGTGTDLCKVAVEWVVVVVEKSPSVVDVVEIFVFAAVVVHVVGAVEF